MYPAARFVHFRRADNHNWVIKASRISVDQALRARSFVAADHANGVEFIDMLGNGHEDGHGTKWLAAEVCVESGDDDPNAA